MRGCDEVRAYIDGLVNLSDDERSGLVALIDKIDESSRFEPLTGCYTNDYFKNVLLLDFVRAHMRAVNPKRRGSDDSTRWAAIIHGDLRRFKLVNDNLGHLVGDQFLKKNGELLRQSVRFHEGFDFPARPGGDEFAVLVTGLTMCRDADEVARRYEENFVANPWHEIHPSFDLDEYAPYVNLGVACLDLDSLINAQSAVEVAEKWYHAADLLTYNSKETDSRFVRGYIWRDDSLQETTVPDERKLRILQQKERADAR